MASRYVLSSPKTLAHYRTSLTIEYTLGADRKSDATYLDACRMKRNHVEYDYVEGASESEAAELLEFVRELRTDVIPRLQTKYPALIPVVSRSRATAW